MWRQQIKTNDESHTISEKVIPIPSGYLICLIDSAKENPKQRRD